MLAARSLGHAGCLGGMIEHVRQRTAERGRVAGPCHEPGLAGDDDLRHGVDRGCDDGNTAGHRLDDRTRKPLPQARASRRRRTPAAGAARLRVAEQQEPVAESRSRPMQPLGLGSQLAVADPDHVDVGPLQGGDRGHHVERRLLDVEPGRCSDDLRPVGNSEQADGRAGAQSRRPAGLQSMGLMRARMRSGGAIFSRTASDATNVPSVRK